MWTTWSSRARRGRALLTAAGVCVAACSPSTSQTANVAPDAPRPARDVSGLSAPPAQAGSQVPVERPVEISSVRLRRVRGDTILTRMMGQPQRMANARDPIAIEVITAEPLGNVDRTSSPEIYLDGVRVVDTWPLPPTRLIAFVPDRAILRAGMLVTVAWLGNEERTRSRRPVPLTDEHLRDLR